MRLILGLLFAHLALAQYATFTASHSSATFGQEITFTLTVNVAAPTGKVTFFDGIHILGIRGMSGSSATLKTRALPAGIRRIRAVYWGDPAMQQPTGGSLSVQITPAPSAGFRRPIDIPLTPGIIGTSVAFGGGLFSDNQRAYLSTPLVAGDFNGDLKSDLAIVVNRSRLLVLLGQADGSFMTSMNLSISGVSLVSGDWNCDGKLDLALISSSYVLVNLVSLIEGNGDGTFQSPVPFAFGSGLTHLVTADFNADFKPDLALMAYFPSVGRLRIFHGNCDGSFTSAGGEIKSVWRPLQFRVEELYQDLSPQIVFLGYTPGATGARFEITGPTPGDEAGGLNREFRSGAPLPFSTNGFTFGHFTRDDSIDLAVAAYFGNFVIRRDASGAQHPILTSPARIGDFIEAGDFNGDGLLDAVVAGHEIPFAVLLGNGDGTFADPVLYPEFATGPPVIGDFNGDGKTDLLLYNKPDASLRIFFGGGTPNLTVKMDAPGGFVQGQPGSYRVIVTNSGEGVTSGPISVTGSLPAGMTPVSIQGAGWTCTLANLTCIRWDQLPFGTSFPEIKITATGGDNLTGAFRASAMVTSVNDGVTASNSASHATRVRAVTTLSLSISPGASTTSQRVTLTAILGAPDTDGKVSFYDGATLLGSVPVSPSSRQAVWSTSRLPEGVRGLSARYQGGQSYAPVSSPVLPHKVSAGPAAAFMQEGAIEVQATGKFLRPGDFNNDGVLDLAVMASFMGTSIRLGLRNGQFEEAKVMHQSWFFDDLLVGDFNRDGDADLIGIQGPAEPVRFFPGNGDGSFGDPITVPVPLGLNRWCRPSNVSDFNRDGAADLACIAPDAVVVWLSNGDGTFEIVTTNVSLQRGGVFAELNNDGMEDLIAFDPLDSSRMHILLARGDGSFRSSGISYNSPRPFSPAAPPRSFLSGDFNGDGKADLVHITQGRIAFFAGKGDGTLRPPTVSVISEPLPLETIRDVTAWDFNGDGQTDIGILVVAPTRFNTGWNGSLIIAAGAGGGTFQRSSTIPNLGDATSMVAGDFNADGRADLAVSVPEERTSGSAKIWLFFGTDTPSAHTGLVESVSCEGGISGWAADGNRPGQSIGVTLWDGDLYSGSVVANAPHPQAGRHAFRFQTPFSALSGRPHTVQVKPVGSTTTLPGVSTLICP